MKRFVFAITIAALTLVSCAKDEIPELPESKIVGKWMLDRANSTYQNNYTNKYIRYVHDNVSDTIIFDEALHHRTEDMHYGYWNVGAYYAEYYYQFYDGEVRNGTVSYYINGDDLRFGKTWYTIIRLNSQKLEVEFLDTTYFIDEDGDRQIKRVQTIHNVFDKE